LFCRIDAGGRAKMPVFVLSVDIFVTRVDATVVVWVFSKVFRFDSYDWPPEDTNRIA
jgi:hypothetical protein